MNERLKKIVEVIGSIDYVKIITDFQINGDVINGNIEVAVDNVILKFEVKILPPYPLQFHERETIVFANRDLLEYNHVNADGSICVHTFHSVILEEKLHFDFSSLRQWIKHYYIGNKNDVHYEHIIVPTVTGQEKKVFLFTDIEHRFTKGQFGYFKYSILSDAVVNGEKTITNIIQEFEVRKRIFKCNWSSHYQALKTKKGVFYFMENPPVVNKRFTVNSWIELETLVSQEFFRFLQNVQKQVGITDIILLIGYRITESEIHWQAVMIPSNNFPNYGQLVRGMNNWIGRFRDQPIIWEATRNSSYKYFFGRGALNKKLTESKILIIGIGAIGSQVATILTRGGCRQIHLFDYDTKEPENVCRSEYKFLTGIQNKVDDLGSVLFSISPFVEIAFNDKLMDVTKFVINDEHRKSQLEPIFNDYDFIFDCSADNDVAYILDQLTITAEIFNLSITNHARELIFATKPNIYNWVTEIFEKLHSDQTDVYNPTGCWSPTFKASYNDIAVLVQYGLKHINKSLEANIPVRNFYLSTEEENVFSIKMKQF